MKMSKFPRSNTNESPGERELLLFIDFPFVYTTYNSSVISRCASEVSQFNAALDSGLSSDEIKFDWAHNTMKLINMIQTDINCINIVNNGLKEKKRNAQ